MVSAWAESNEIVLGQRKVDEKSNEITAIPELLKILDISGCIITIDAMGTQTHIAQTIVEAEAEYVLSVKENQGHLFRSICRGSGPRFQVLQFLIQTDREQRT
jgi:hypothetical protein